MKRRFAALLAATAIVGVASAFAANPFSDVTPSDWAYQAVSQLAAQGIINGYPDGTFQGGKDITRFEVAQMVAKAIAHEDRANAEQAAVINRLANEFASELNSLGVRVENLENRVGNVKFTGDARVKFAHRDNLRIYKVNGSGESVKSTAQDAEAKDTYSYRVRLNATAKVAENTEAGARLVLESEFGKEAATTVKFDRAWVSQDFGWASVKAGRQSSFLGNGLVLDSALDGVTAYTTVGGVDVAAGYGYRLVSEKVQRDLYVGHTPAELDNTIWYAQASRRMAGVDLTGYALHVTETFVKNGQPVNNNHNVYGVAANYEFGNVGLSAEYARRSRGGDLKPGGHGRNAWVVGADYQAGPANFMLQYFHQGVNSPIVETTWDQAGGNNWKGFVATATYAVAENAKVKVAYSFRGKPVDESVIDAIKDTAPHAKWYGQFVYNF